MIKNYLGSLKGKFLIAMPELADPNFSYSVTCICEHTSEGAMGVMINRIHGSLCVKDILDELSIDAVAEAAIWPVFMGGPVHLGQIFIIHGPPFHWESTMGITPTLALSNSRDIINAIAAGTGPSAFIIAAGCAGWGPNQLEAEMLQNAWLTCDADDKILFHAEIDERWRLVIEKMGIAPGMLAGTAGHA